MDSLHTFIEKLLLVWLFYVLHLFFETNLYPKGSRKRWHFSFLLFLYKMVHIKRFLIFVSIFLCNIFFFIKCRKTFWLSNICLLILSHNQLISKMVYEYNFLWKKKSFIRLHYLVYLFETKKIKFDWWKDFFFYLRPEDFFF